MGIEAKINKAARSLTGFNRATLIIVGIVELDVYSPPVISEQKFMIINEVSPYNDILGSPWIDKINVISFATHKKIHYLIPGGSVNQINNNQVMASRCSALGLKKKQASTVHTNKPNRTSSGGSRSHS
ncbi:unnamed protein product [Prunus armeniaca]